MSDDDTTGDGNQTQGRSRRRMIMAEGVGVPFGTLLGVVIAFSIFLFERIETRCESIDSKITSTRNERIAQCGALQQDVVRLQDSQANTASIMAEIKIDLREILNKVDHLEHRP